MHSSVLILENGQFVNFAKLFKEWLEIFFVQITRYLPDKQFNCIMIFTWTWMMINNNWIIIMNNAIAGDVTSASNISWVVAICFNWTSGQDHCTHYLLSRMQTTWMTKKSEWVSKSERERERGRERERERGEEVKMMRMLRSKYTRSEREKEREEESNNRSSSGHTWHKLLEHLSSQAAARVREKDRERKREREEEREREREGAQSSKCSEWTNATAVRVLVLRTAVSLCSVERGVSAQPSTRNLSEQFISKAKRKPASKFWRPGVIGRDDRWLGPSLSLTLFLSLSLFLSHSGRSFEFSGTPVSTRSNYAFRHPLSIPFRVLLTDWSQSCSWLTFQSTSVAGCTSAAHWVTWCLRMQNCCMQLTTHIPRHTKRSERERERDSKRE